MTTSSASPESGATGDGGAARSLRGRVARPAREAVGVAEFAAGIWRQRARLWVAGRFHGDPDGRLHLRAGRRDPYAVYADVRAAGSFARLQAGDRVTASHRVCRTVLRSRGFGVRPETDPALTGAVASPTAGIDLGFLDRNPPDHTRLRRLVAPAFSPKMMAGYRPQIEAVADELLDAAVAKGRFDLIRDFATPLPVAVITKLLGIDSADTDALARHGQAVGTALDGIRSVRHARTLMTAAAGLQQMFTDLIARRRAEPADDLVSRLLVAEDAGELTANELFVTCHLLLVAGFETTVNLIGNGTAALLDHPEQWGTLRADPDRAPAAVEEVLRYDPPVQSTYRFALADNRDRRRAVPRRRRRRAAARRHRPRSQGVRRPRPVRHRPGRPARPPGLLRRHPLLRRRTAGPAGGRHRLPRARHPAATARPGRPADPAPVGRDPRVRGLPGHRRMTAALVGPRSLTADHAALAAGSTDPVALAQATCDRIDAVDPVLLAFLPEPDRRARLSAAAEAVVREHPNQAERSPLWGIPVGIKDILRVDGLPTTAGSHLPAELFAAPESAVVRLLRAAGAVVAGKTRTAEFASIAPAETRNPHAPAHTPGGSSSGSAAAVAAGMVGLAIGTQTIGSMIRPAAYCGVVGFKPTYGRIPIDGTIANSPTFDTLGAFTADVAGAALAAAALCADWRAVTGSVPPVLGVPAGAYLDATTPAGRASYTATLEALQRNGIQVREVSIFDGPDEITAVGERHRTVSRYEFSQLHRAWFAEYADRYRPETAWAMRIGLQISEADYERDLAGCLAFAASMGDRMAAAGIDAWIAPAATGPAPAGLTTTGDPTMNLPWTQARLPVISLPTGSDPGGLPLGVQLAGRPGADEALLTGAQLLWRLLRR